jgi:hypothetical protein
MVENRRADSGKVYFLKQITLGNLSILGAGVVFAVTLVWNLSSWTSNVENMFRKQSAQISAIDSKGDALNANLITLDTKVDARLTGIENKLYTIDSAVSSLTGKSHADATPLPTQHASNP